MLFRSGRHASVCQQNFKLSHVSEAIDPLCFQHTCKVSLVWLICPLKGSASIVSCGVLIVDTLATARSLAIQQMQGAVCNNWCLDRSAQRRACTWVNVSGNNIP